MLSRRMRDKPIEISQGSLGSLRVADPQGGGGGGGLGVGTAKRGTLLGVLYQRHLEIGDQVTGHT